MTVTYHAAKRFVERVLKKERYTRCDVDRAKDLLQKLFSSVVTHKRYIPLPAVKGYIAVVKENIVVTILEKNSRWRKRVKLHLLPIADICPHNVGIFLIDYKNPKS